MLPGEWSLTRIMLVLEGASSRTTRLPIPEQSAIVYAEAELHFVHTVGAVLLFHSFKSIYILLNAFVDIYYM